MSGDSPAAQMAAVEAIAREAGALALEHFAARDTLNVRSKTPGVYDTASEADVEVEHLVRAELARRFPRDGFLGEETASDPEPGDSGRIWVVDPIDGTDCFVNGIPVWCISIALVDGDEIELGVIYDPNRDELFSALGGQGAQLNGEPVRASSAGALREGVIGVGINHRVAPDATLEIIARLLAAGGMFQRNGSGALSLAYVACGRLIGYYEAHINAWDAAAALALVREAGGWTNDFLAGEGLARGNEVAACGPGLVGAFRELCSLG